MSFCSRWKNSSLSSPGGIGVEEFDHDRAGQPQERAARPEQAGVQRDRNAGHADLGIEMRDAELVARLGAGGAARALRKDDELAAAADFLAGARRSCRSAPASRAPRSTGTMRPFHMHQPKIGIHISSRLTMKVKSSNSQSSAKVSQVDWCLAATISGPLRQLLQAAELDPGAADHAQQPHADAAPELGHRRARRGAAAPA